MVGNSFTQISQAGEVQAILHREHISSATFAGRKEEHSRCVDHETPEEGDGRHPRLAPQRPVLKYLVSIFAEHGYQGEQTNGSLGFLVEVGIKMMVLLSLPVPSSFSETANRGNSVSFKPTEMKCEYSQSTSFVGPTVWIRSSVSLDILAPLAWEGVPVKHI